MLFDGFAYSYKKEMGLPPPEVRIQANKTSESDEKGCQMAMFEIRLACQDRLILYPVMNHRHKCEPIREIRYFYHRKSIDNLAQIHNDSMV